MPNSAWGSSGSNATATASLTDVVPGTSAGVTTFNTRTGAVTLTSLDVTTALTFTPIASATWGSITGASAQASPAGGWNTLGIFDRAVTAPWLSFRESGVEKWQAYSPSTGKLCFWSAVAPGDVLTLNPDRSAAFAGSLSTNGNSFTAGAITGTTGYFTGNVGLGIVPTTIYGSMENLYAAGPNGGVLILGEPAGTFKAVVLGDFNNQRMDVGTSTNHVLRFLTNNARVGGFSTAGAFDTLGTVSSAATGDNVFGAAAGAAQTTLTLRTAAGQNRLIQFFSGATMRWQLGADGTAESGGNAGTYFMLKALDDSGAVIDTPLLITRAAAGQITFSSARPVSMGALGGTSASFTNTLTVGSDASGANIIQRCANGWQDIIQVYRGGSLKWALQDNGSGTGAVFTTAVSMGALTATTGAFSGKLSTILSLSSDVVGLFQNTSSTGYGFRIDGGITGKYALSVRDYTGAEKFQIDGGGNVGIGVSPSYLLDVAASSNSIIRLTRTASHNVQLIAGSGGYFAIGIDGSGGGTERVKIDSTGLATFNYGASIAASYGLAIADGAPGATTGKLYSIATNQLYWSGASVITASNIDGTAAGLAAYRSLLWSPQIGSWATFGALPATTGATGLYPPNCYIYSTVIVDTAGDNTAGTLYQNQSGTWVRVGSGNVIAGKATFGNIAAGAIGATSLATNFVLANTIKNSGYSEDTANSGAPTGGFKLDAYPGIAAWSSGTTYSQGQSCTYSGYIFTSKTNSNHSNTPVIPAAQWDPATDAYWTRDYALKVVDAWIGSGVRIGNPGYFTLSDLGMRSIGAVDASGPSATDVVWWRGNNNTGISGGAPVLIDPIWTVDSTFNVGDRRCAGTGASGLTLMNSKYVYAYTTAGDGLKTGQLVTTPAAWASGTTYAAGNQVSSGGNTFTSLQAGNLGHTPVVTLAWNSGTTYAVGDQCTYLNCTFTSLVAGNLNNAPTVGGNASWSMGSNLAGYWLDGGPSVYQGSWSSATTYAANQTCQNVNRIFQSKAAGNLNHTPTVGGDAYWNDLGGIYGPTGSTNVADSVLDGVAKAKCCDWMWSNTVGTAGCKPWTRSTSYAVGDLIASDYPTGVTGYYIGTVESLYGNPTGGSNIPNRNTGCTRIYRCTTAGTSGGSLGPTGTGSSIADNTCVWAYWGENTGSGERMQIWGISVGQATGSEYKWEIRLQPKTNNDNLDAVTHVEVDVAGSDSTWASRGNGVFQTVIALPQRTYYAPSTPAHVLNMTRTQFSFEAASNNTAFYINSSPYGLTGKLRIRLHNVYGTSNYVDVGNWTGATNTIPTPYANIMSSGSIGGNGGGSGGGGGFHCPEGWVLITTLRGDIRADEVVVGDQVPTLHEATGRLGVYEVVAVEPSTNETVMLEMRKHLQDGTSVITSMAFAINHRVMRNGVWEEVRNICAGSRLQATDGSTIEVLDVRPRGINEVIQITVADAHTYSTNGLLSHNVKYLK